MLVAKLAAKYDQINAPGRRIRVMIGAVCAGNRHDRRLIENMHLSVSGLTFRQNLAALEYA